MCVLYEMLRGQKEYVCAHTKEKDERAKEREREREREKKKNKRAERAQMCMLLTETAWHESLQTRDS